MSKNDSKRLENKEVLEVAVGMGNQVCRPIAFLPLYMIYIIYMTYNLY